jgi:hypothetical protein
MIENQCSFDVHIKLLQPFLSIMDPNHVHLRYNERWDSYNDSALKDSFEVTYEINQLPKSNRFVKNGLELEWLIKQGDRLLGAVTFSLKYTDLSYFPPDASRGIDLP